MNAKLLLLSACIVSSSTAVADMIDVDSIMTQKAKPIIDSLRQQCFRSARGSMAAAIRCSGQYPWAPTFQDVMFSPGETRKSSFNRSPIPNAAESASNVIENCSSTVASFSDGVSTELSTSLSIVTKDSVKSSRSAGAEAKLSVAGILDAGTNFDIAQEVSFERAETKVETRKSTYTVQVDKELPPYTALIVMRDFTRYRASYEFDGDIYVDGKLMTEDGSKKGRISTDPIYYSGLMNGDDKITVRGSMSIDDHEERSTRYIEVPLDPNLCGARVAVQRAQLRQSDRSSDFSSTGPAMLGSRNHLSGHSGATVYDLNDGGYRLITELEREPEYNISQFKSSYSFVTANVIGNVSVRARSVEGNGCYATIQNGNDERTLYAPAGKWSEWTSLATHAGEAFYDLYVGSSCTNGTEFEVGYFQ